MRFQVSEAETKLAKSKKALLANDALQQELRTKLEAAAAARAELQTKVDCLQDKVTALYQQALRENGGNASTVVTAAAVHGWFAQLPAELAAMPGAQAKIQGILAEFSQLDAAASAVHTAVPESMAVETEGVPAGGTSNPAAIVAQQPPPAPAQLPPGATVLSAEEMREVQRLRSEEAELRRQAALQRKDEADEDYKLRLGKRPTDASSSASEPGSKLPKVIA